MTQTNATWAQGISGDWTAAANWAAGVVPGITGTITSTDTASLSVGGTYTVTVGATSAWSIGSVSVAAPGATLLVGSGGLAVSSGVTLTAGTLMLGGMLTGGTVSERGGTLAVQSASYSAGLNSVTLDGALNLSGAGLRLGLVGANQFLGASGSGAGSILLTGAGTTLSVTDSETLANLSLTFGSTSSSAAVLQLGSYFAQSLTLGSGAVVNVTGRALISNLAQTVSKQVLNSGSISVASGGLLEVGTEVQLASGGGSGALAIQSGGTLQLDGSYTTAGLKSLVTSDAGTVVVTGLLDNSGATLTLGSGGTLPALVLQGGTLKGGTVKVASGSLSLLSGGTTYTPISSTLDGVTLQGTLDLSAAAGSTPGANQVLFRDGLTLQGASGSGPGTVLLTGAGQSLLAADGETLDNAAITLGNATAAATLGAASGGALTLGTHATMTVSGLARIAGGSFTNNGTIQVTSGSRLDIAAGTTLGAGMGTLSLASGSTLELDGAVTSGALKALVTTGGGVVEVDGTLSNGGQTLAVQPGPFGAVLLRGGTIQGGTVQLASGSFQVAGGTNGTSPVLNGVALQGTLNLSQPISGTVGTYLGLQGGVTYAGGGGSGQGAILLTGPGTELRALDQETLANVAVTLGSGTGAAVLGTAAGGGFTLASGASISVAGAAQIGGSGSFANNGTIQVGTGARLDVASGVTIGASKGTITVAAGGTFALDGSLTTAALLGFGLSGPGAVAIDGTLSNAGSTLQLKPGGALASLTLAGGTVSGGILSLAGGTLLTSAGAQLSTLDGVTVQGMLNLGQPQSGTAAALQLRDSVVFEGAGGTGPGSIVLTGQNQSIVVGDSETLNNVAVSLGGGAHLCEAAGGTLTLGTGFSMDTVGQGWLTGGLIRNQGAITVESNQTLHVDSGFTNVGTLTVDYGGRVLVGGTTNLALFTALESGITGTGTLGLDSGAILDLGGGTLNLAAGTPLDGATMLGTIRNGTVTATGGGLAPGNLTLDGVTWEGTLAATGGSLTLLDGTQVQEAGGGAGLLDATLLTGPLTISGTFDKASILLGGGTLQAGAAGAQLGSGASLTLGAGATVAGTVTDAGSATLSNGQAAFTGCFTNAGSITLEDGTLAAANLTNSGTITLDDNSTLQLAGAAALGGTVAFGGTGANRLAFGAAGYDSATLSNFRYGDTVDLGGLTYGGGLELNLQGSTLQVLKGAIAVASFTLQAPAGGASYGAGQFDLMSDGAGGTLLTTQYRAATPVWSGAGADFDAAWYLAEYPSVAASGMDPLTQYLTVGWKEGYNPNPWFNTDYYLNQNPDVAAAGVNPLVHYEQFGWQEGRDPSVLFSTDGYLAANPDVAAAGMDPLEHYLDYGQYEGRQPVAATPHDSVAQDPLVDGAWYFAQYPDAAASGLDPTQYYDQVGWKLDENPDPWFDTKYYLTVNPDVAAAGVNPLQHFEQFGWTENREPSLAFNDQAYLAANPDVAAAGVDPLVHYMQFGQFEGRMTFINTPTATAAPDPLVDRAYYFNQLATIVPASADAFASYDQVGWKLGLNPDQWFDTSYYLAQNPDVAKNGMDPLVHFEEYGWKEGRNPSPDFSVSKYLAAHPSVAASGVDPLVQFITVGQAQGMQAIPV